MRRIKPGADSGADVVVDSGLSGGEQVIVDGPAARASRQRRSVQSPATPPAGRTLSRCSPPSSSTGRVWPSSSPIVTTIAGMLSLLAIPISQYPDIVPPQVSVTTFYPGASAAVVDATVAQPIEAQVVGVDKLMYMKSVSGNDGSYTLTASFELGTDPDINSVNVNNRVQVALSKLPQDVQRQGVTVKKKSSALLGVLAIYSPTRAQDPLFISNYVTINLLDQIKSTPGVGDATLLGPAGLRHAGLGQDRPAHRPRSHHRRHHQRDPGAERAGRRSGASARGRSRTISASSSTSRPRAGSTAPERILEHHPAHESGRLGAAPRRRRPGRARRRQSRSRDAAQRRSGGGYRRSTSRPAPMRSRP